MKKGHIVHIIPSLQYGGAERFVVDLSNLLVDRGYEVSIIVLFDSVPLKKQLKRGVKVFVLQKNGRLSFSLFQKIRKKLKQIKPDLVHTHLFGGDFWGRVVARGMGIPVVTTEHSAGLGEGFWKKTIKKIIKNYSDVYTTPSNYLSDFIKIRYRIKKPVKTVKHGIDLSNYKKIKPLRFKKNKLSVLFLGRFAPEKGFEVALDALSGIRDIPWHLEVVGEGSLKQKMIGKVKKYGLEDRVRFESSADNVWSVFERNDLVLVPSLTEGLGLVAMEAMASGRAVLASNAGGLPEIINDQNTGFLAVAGSVLDFRKKIQWIWEHKHQVQNVAKNGRVYAFKNFSVENEVDEYEKIYRTLIKI